MSAPESALDRIIPAEVTNDRFYRWLQRVASTPGVRTILEIGASAGEGSTEALVSGALRNPGGPPEIHSIEVSTVRFAALVERWKDYPFHHAHHVSSVPIENFPTAEEVTRFYRTVRSRLRNNRLEKVLGWLQLDMDYLRAHPELAVAGIRRIRDQVGVGVFDAVLIDGSEFTGRAELEEVYGARWILLDDTRSYKNWENHARLKADPRYKRVAVSRWRRNGWAVFQRKD
jgi:hypothetical protein